MIDLLPFSVVFGTSVWVLLDSRSIGIKKGSTTGFFNMGPTGWFLACLLCWIAAFPVYLIKRREHLLAVAGGSTQGSVQGDGAGPGSGTGSNTDFGAQLDTLADQFSRGQITPDAFRTQRLALTERVLERTPQDDFMARLSTLADLSTRGFLTEEEFQARKKDLTRRMLEESSDTDSPVSIT
ncbi:MAG: SHOCT domain-containing protein [Acidobacteria bacterium]|nr:SHOCT domain-containing protein [Acidobacteriota bacterium]